MGIGRFIFESMLCSEGIEPRNIAYDAPSAKLLSFLRKYYGLKSFQKQNCNFVVFDDYFARTDEYHFEPMDLERPRVPKQEDAATDAVPKEATPPIEAEPPMEIKQSPPNSDPLPPTAEEQKVPNDDNKDAEHDVSALPAPLGGSGKNYHERQLDWIAKQIEETKKAISESESLIHRHHLQNNVSPYSIDEARAKLEKERWLRIQKTKSIRRTQF